MRAFCKARRLAQPAAWLLLAAACTAARPDSAALAQASVADSNWRLQEPASGPPPALHAPVPKRTLLKNQLTVLSLQKTQLPLCSVSLVLKSGSAQDPRGMPGLASFTAEMLRRGSAKHNAAQMADAIETLGTDIGVSVGEDAIVLSTTALSENIEAAFALLVEQVHSPAFAAPEIERLRKVRMGELAQRDFEPGSSAQAVFRQLLYGNHPYGHLPSGNARSVKALSRAAIKHYYKEHFRPANAALVVVGNLSETQAVALAQAQLGDWQADPEAPAGPQLACEAPTEHRLGVNLVARPNAPQSLILVGELGTARQTPDFYALTVMNAILGGQFDSRINMNLREDKGYSYGARSSFDFLRQRGPFVVSAGVTSKDTAAALREVFKEIDKLREHDISEVELRSAQGHFSLTLPGKFQTVDSTAALLAGLFLYDLPLDYFAGLPDKINAVSLPDVRRVAQTYLRPEAMGVVVVGDPDVVEKSLGELGRGPVTRRSPDGKALKTAAPRQ